MRQRSHYFMLPDGDDYHYTMRRGETLWVPVMGALRPEIFDLLESILDETWDSLRPDEKARTSKAMVAQRILQAIASGERDPARLRVEVVTGVVMSPL